MLRNCELENEQMKEILCTYDVAIGDKVSKSVLYSTKLELENVYMSISAFKSYS